MRVGHGSRPRLAVQKRKCHLEKTGRKGLVHLSGLGVEETEETKSHHSDTNKIT